MADNPNNSRFQCAVKVGSQTIQQSDIFDLVIESELDQPDSCAITLTPDAAAKYRTTIKATDDYTVSLGHQGDKQDPAFAGEVTSFAPVFAPGGQSGGRLVVQGLNALHSLTRVRSSIAYADPNGKLTDVDIIKQILQRNSSLKLEVDYGGTPPTVPHTHVYQFNQTDLEFLRYRAARLGYFVMVRGQKLLFQQHSTTPSGLELILNAKRTYGEGSPKIALESFTPRVSTAAQTTQVRIRAWNTATRKHMVCIAPSDQAGGNSSMADNDGKSAIAQKYPDACVVRNDIPFTSIEEGNAIAASLLKERRLSYVTGVGSLPGDARIKPGIVVKITTGETMSEGNYIVWSVRHSYRTAGEARYLTEFMAKRDSTANAGSDDSQTDS